MPMRLRRMTMMSQERVGMDGEVCYYKGDMKVCSNCKFDNPDSQLECMRCGAALELTKDQEQTAKMEAEKLTDAVVKGEEEKQALLDSWMEAMKHRFDWLWRIGDKLTALKYKGTLILLLGLIAVVLLGLSWMFSQLGL